jgi:fluoride exporter
MNVLLWIGVALAGGVGSVARLAADRAAPPWADRLFPLGTLAVNLSGSLILGLLAGLAVAGDALLLAGTALIGSYTTFSTWMDETRGLAEEGERGRAAANLAGSLALGLAAVAAGRALGRLL